MTKHSDSNMLLEVKNLGVRFAVKRNGFFGGKSFLKAVDDISFDLAKGKTLAIVGESGSGKTTLGRAMLKAAPISQGDVHFDDGEVEYSLKSLGAKELKDYRKRAQLIFQDPYAALSPRMTVRDIIAEPLEVMGLTNSREETDARVREIAAKCRLNLEHLRRFPHAFSGGQRQRISIARALVSGTKFIVADESVAALDVSIQADVLNLLKAIQQDMGLTFLFISHDMAVVERVSHHVGVMYLGRIVEMGPRQAVFEDPRHPYTQALMKAVPIADPRKRKSEKDLNFKPIPSPIHGLDYAPEPSIYREVEPGHKVLITDSGY